MEEQRSFASFAHVATFAIVKDLGLGLWGLALVRFLVVDGRYGVGLVGRGAFSGDVRSHEDGGVGRHGGFDEDIGPLADLKQGQSLSINGSAMRRTPSVTTFVM